MDERLVVRYVESIGQTVVDCRPSFDHALNVLRPYFPNSAAVLQSLLTVQQDYLSLAALLDSTSVGILASRYPILVPKFSAAEDAWAKVAAYARKFPVARAFCDDDDCVGALAAAKQNTEARRASLAAVIRTAREECPRLLLLPDDELLHLLSSALRPPADGSPAKLLDTTAIFEFSGLVLDPDAVDAVVIGVRGRDGAIFFFSRPLPSIHSVPQLLQRVEEELRTSLQLAVEKAVRSSPVLVGITPLAGVTPRHTQLPGVLVRHHPAQAAEVVSRIRFTRVVEDALFYGRPTLPELQKQEEAVLTGFEELLAPTKTTTLYPAKEKPQLDARQRRVLLRLMHIQMHNLEIVQRLIAENVKEVTSPAWRSTLRFYWSDVKSALAISCGGVDADYGWDYHDWANDRVAAVPLDTAATATLVASCNRPNLVTLHVPTSGEGGENSASAAIADLACSVGRRCHQAPTLPVAGSGEDQNTRRELLRLLGGAFATGCWLLLPGLNSCAELAQVAVRTALDAYTSSLTQNGELTKLVLKPTSTARDGDCFSIPAIRRCVICTLAGSPNDSVDGTDQVENMKNYLPVRNPLLQRYTNTQKGAHVLRSTARTPSATGSLRSSVSTNRGFAVLPATGEFVTALGANQAQQSLPRLLTSSGEFSLASARQAGEWTSTLLNALLGLPNAPKSIFPGEPLFRQLAAVALYVRARAVTIREEECIALALHAVILPRLDGDAAIAFLLKMKDIFPEVDFRRFYRTEEQRVSLVVRAELKKRGLQANLKPYEIDDEDRPADSTHAPNKLGRLISKGRGSILDTWIPPPKDTYIIRMQCLLVTLLSATVDSHVPPRPNAPSPLIKGPHFIITGGRGAGKTTAYHVLRSVAASLSPVSTFRPPASTALVAPLSDTNCEKFEVSGLLGAGASDRVIGFTQPVTREWQDGPLLAHLRRAATFVNSHATEHFWLFIAGMPPLELLDEIFQPLVQHQGFTPPAPAHRSAAVSLPDRVHLVFEIPYAHLSACPPLFVASCSVLHVLPEGLRPSLQALPPLRPHYLENDVSGSLLTEHELKEEFERLDRNGNGWISREEFAERLKSEYEHFGMQHEHCKQVEALLDQLLEDDRLSFEEFAIVMLRMSQR